MSIFFFLTNYNLLIFNLTKTFMSIANSFLIKFFFLLNYYILNEVIWQEGFLIDFIQKKITDNWIKKFLIYSSYLFSERLVFDKIVKFYLNLIILPLHKFFVFEVNNVANILFITISFFFFLLSFLFFFLFCHFFLIIIIF